MAFKAKAGWVATGCAAIILACAPTSYANPQLEWEDETASPGETVVLEPTGNLGNINSARVRISETTTLPAGWSVWGKNGTFRVAVPATAQHGETVTLEFVTAGGTLIDDVDITVKEQGAVRSSSTSQSQSTPWVTSFLATLGQFLS